MNSGSTYICIGWEGGTVAILIMYTVSTQGLFAAYISSGFEEFEWK